MSDWEIEDGKYGKKVTIFSKWVDEWADIFKREGVEELKVMSPYPPHIFERSSLDFLAMMPWLKALVVLDQLVRDIEGIHSLTELRSVYMGDYSKKPIDFSRFTHLKECRMEFSKNRISIAFCEHLDLLVMGYYSFRDLGPIERLRELTTLSLVQGSLADISGIGGFANLTDLELSMLRNLEDISPISSLKNIQTLTLQDSKGFRDLSSLAGINSLRRLNISNCGQIASLSPLLDCPNLEALTFGGDTNIVDGDLKVLMRMPSLKYVTLANRKHYNMKRDDLPMFQSRYRELPLTPTTRFN